MPTTRPKRLSHEAASILASRRAFHVIYHNRVIELVRESLNSKGTEFLFKAESKLIGLHNRGEIATRIATRDDELQTAIEFWKAGFNSRLKRRTSTVLQRFKEELAAELTDSSLPPLLTCLSGYAIVVFTKQDKCDLYCAQPWRLLEEDIPQVKEWLSQSVDKWRDYWLHQKTHGKYLDGERRNLSNRLASYLELKASQKKRDKSKISRYSVSALIKELEEHGIQQLLEGKRFVSIEDITEAWRQLDDSQRQTLVKEFKKIEENEYHRLIFGKLDTPATIDGFNEWFGKHCAPDAPRFETKDYPFVGRAIQHFRNTLGVSLWIRHPKSGESVACTIFGTIRSDRNTGRFKVVEANSKQATITQPSQLPHLFAE